MQIISSIEKGLQKNKVGQLIGFVVGEHRIGQYAYGGPLDIFGVLDWQIKDLLQNPHFPNLLDLRYHLFRDDRLGAVLKPSLAAFIGGMIAKEVNIHPTVTRLGRLAESLGLNMAIGITAAGVLDESTRFGSPESSPPSSGGSGGTLRGG